MIGLKSTAGCHVCVGEALSIMVSYVYLIHTAYSSSISPETREGCPLSGLLGYCTSLTYIMNCIYSAPRWHDYVEEAPYYFQSAALNLPNGGQPSQRNLSLAVLKLRIPRSSALIFSTSLFLTWWLNTCGKQLSNLLNHEWYEGKMKWNKRTNEWMNEWARAEGKKGSMKA